MSTGSCILRRS